ncbi:MAG: phenylalanine--tRNA ligase subunit beta, partial [Actinobacteria bacterium]|nr:phenylalanine--tRNA ligase subunit beta [Actinomycetota bacterium]
SWLRNYVALEMPVAELVHRLSISAAEVNTVEARGPIDKNGNHALFLVGRVLEAGKHPNADRLQLCQVDVGEGEPRQIVCGAWNFGAGATVAVALPGARLPGAEQPLGEAKLRGEVSRGMILSERELELGADHDGILVLPETEPGTSLADVLPLADAIMDVEPTGNRVDLLSVYGLAREVAALFRLELEPPPGRDPNQGGDESFEIAIDDLIGCPRYIGRTFANVEVAASPPWLRARISAAGMRPISNVVDVTNYVMLALGNPIHAFDRSTLAQDRIVVRRAAAGEKLRTLDGTARELVAADLVIADGERAVALAGIMGGEETEVRDSTTELLLEAANFEPVGLLRTSERLKLRTEGSNRWEKGVDPHLASQAAALATQLLVELTGATWVGHADVHGELPERQVVRLRPERADRLIGLETPPEEQRSLLERFGFEVADDDVIVPTWRARDVTREVDLVEEIARVRLDDVPFTLPARRAMFGSLSPNQRLRRRVEDVLVGAGLAEVYTPSLVPTAAEPGGLTLPDPVGDQATMRTTLLHGLVETARGNVSSGNERLAFFEIARVYLPRGSELPEEHLRVGGLVEGGFARVKGVLEVLYGSLKVELSVAPATQPFLYPGRAAGVEAGWLGELHPELLDGQWSAFELDLELLLAGSRDPVQYEDVITFPPVKQDLAFVVDLGVPAAAIFAAAREAAGPELRDVRFLSDFREPPIPAGKKSLAFRVEFRSPERTLTDADVAPIRERIVVSLAERFEAELRA